MKLTADEQALLKRVFKNAVEMAEVCGDELDGVVPEDADPVKVLQSLRRKVLKLSK